MKRIIAALGLCAALIAGTLPAAAQVTQPRYCGKSAFANLSASAGTTQIAPLTTQSPFTASPSIGGNAPLTTIYICGYVLIVNGTAPTAQFVYGFPASLPGTGCGASPTALSPTYPTGVFIDTSSVARGFEVPAGNVLCVVTTGTSLAISVQVYYDNSPI